MADSKVSCIEPPSSQAGTIASNNDEPSTKNADVINNMNIIQSSDAVISKTVLTSSPSTAAATTNTSLTSLGNACPSTQTVFSWKKTLPTRAHIVSVINVLQEPITLDWHEDKTIFRSSQLTVPCGLYKASLDIDGQRIPIDPVDIRFYTFEVDLFVNEDYEEKALKAAEQAKSKREKDKQLAERERQLQRAKQQRAVIAAAEEKIQQRRKHQLKSHARCKETVENFHTSSANSSRPNSSRSKARVVDKDSSLQKSKRLAISCTNLPTESAVTADMYRTNAYLSDMDNPADISILSESSTVGYGGGGQIGDKSRSSLTAAYEKLVRQQMDNRMSDEDERGYDRRLVEHHQRRDGRDEDRKSASAYHDRYPSPTRRDNTSESRHHGGDRQVNGRDLAADPDRTSSWRSEDHDRRSASPTRNGYGSSHYYNGSSPVRASSWPVADDTTKQLPSSSSHKPYSSSSTRDAPTSSGYGHLPDKRDVPASAVPAAGDNFSYRNGGRDPSSIARPPSATYESINSHRPESATPSGRFNSLPRQYKRQAGDSEVKGNSTVEEGSIIGPYRKFASTRNLASNTSDTLSQSATLPASTGTGAASASDTLASSRSNSSSRLDPYPQSPASGRVVRIASDTEYDVRSRKSVTSSSYGPITRDEEKRAAADASKVLSSTGLDGRYSYRRSLAPPPSARNHQQKTETSSDVEYGGRGRPMVARPIGVTTPLVPGQSGSQGPPSPYSGSQSSTHTITPTSYLQSDYKMQDHHEITRANEKDNERAIMIEYTLAEKEREIARLKQTNEQLLKDSQRLGEDREQRLGKLNTNEQVKLCSQLMADKENLAADVWKLQQELANAKAAQAEAASQWAVQATAGSTNHLDNYDPNHPSVLHKKLHDIQSQLQDLQEAHETAIHNLARSEKELTELRQRNAVLQIGRTTTHDLELENASLREQLERLKEVSSGPYGDGGRDRERDEEDEEELRKLRAENRQLLDDNVRLTRHVQQTSSERWEDNEREAIPSRTGESWNRGMGNRYSSVDRGAERGRSGRDDVTRSIQIRSQSSRRAADDDVPYRTTATVKFNLTDRPAGERYSAQQRSSDMIDDVLDDSLSFRPTTSTFLRSADVTFDSYIDDSTQRERSSSANRQAPILRESRRGVDASFLSDELGEFDADKGRSRHGEFPRGTGDDNVTWSSLASKPRRRDSVASNSTDLILDEADRELHSRADSDDSPPVDSRYQRSASPSRYDRPVDSDTRTTYSQRGGGDNDIDDDVSVSGKVPYVPLSASDVSVGDTVKFLRHGGKISRGLIKYVGSLDDKKDTYLGVELEGEAGKHDGLYEGKRYFHCQPNRGVFVAFNKVVLAWQRG